MVTHTRIQNQFFQGSKSRCRFNITDLLSKKETTFLIKGHIIGQQSTSFASYEWKIAWRYLRAKRAEGGVSVMTWISLIGITLAVFALVATLSVRSGFRTEIVDTILGANSHITLYKAPSQDQYGNVSRTFKDYDEIASNLLSLPSVKGSAPLIRSQIMATFDNRNTGLEVFGISYETCFVLIELQSQKNSKVI